MEVHLVSEEKEWEEREGGRERGRERGRGIAFTSLHWYVVYSETAPF